MAKRESNLYVSRLNDSWNNFVSGWRDFIYMALTNSARADLVIVPLCASPNDLRALSVNAIWKNFVSRWRDRGYMALTTRLMNQRSLERDKCLGKVVYLRNKRTARKRQLFLFGSAVVSDAGIR